jgi:putative Mg2+ transporter-C (MgtC) family protein
MTHDLELLARLILAAVLGGAIGAERELNDQPAGLRTHMLLTTGACLFTLVSAYGFGRGPTPAGSPPRSSPGSASSAAAPSSGTG